jgi:hypothetical protein
MHPLLFKADVVDKMFANQAKHWNICTSAYWLISWVDQHVFLGLLYGHSVTAA